MSERADVRVGRRFRFEELEYRITWRGVDEHGDEGVRATAVPGQMIGDRDTEPLEIDLAIDRVPACYD